MALSLGRAGLRTLLTGSHAAKGIAGRQIPVAGFKSLLPGSSSPLRPQYTALHSQFRVAHSLVVVVVPDGPIDADSVAMAVKKELADLDVKLRAGRFDPKEEATDLNKDADSKLGFSDEYPGKQQKLISYVTDGRLSGLTETEMQTLFNDNLRNAMNGRNDDRYVVAIQKICKNIDVALYGVKWTVEACFEKLEARTVGQSIRDARPKRNFYARYLHAAGKKIFPRKVILAKRAVLIVLPHVSRYYLYCLFGFSLLTADVPWSVVDYALIFVGSQWLASHEMKTKFEESYKFYKNGGKKLDGKKDAVEDADQKQD